MSQRRRRAGIVEYTGTAALVGAAALFGTGLVVLLAWSALSDVQHSSFGNAAGIAALALVVPATAVGAWGWRRSEHDTPLHLAMTVAALVLVATSLTFAIVLLWAGIAAG